MSNAIFIASELIVLNDNLATASVKILIANLGATGERGGLSRIRPVLCHEGKQYSSPIYAYCTKIAGRSVIGEWSDLAPAVYKATRPGGVCAYFRVDEDRRIREIDAREAARLVELERDQFYDLMW